MKIISTKNNSFVSKVIRILSRSNSSHVAFIVLDKFVIHSNFLGVNLQWKATFLEKQTIVREIEHKMTSESEYEWISYVLNSYDNKNYDFKAFIFFGWRLLLYRLFNKPLPTENTEGETRAFLCVGLGAFVPMAIRGSLTEKTAEMLIPDEFMNVIQLNIDNGGK